MPRNLVVLTSTDTCVNSKYQLQKTQFFYSSDDYFSFVDLSANLQTDKKVGLYHNNQNANEKTIDKKKNLPLTEKPIIIHNQRNYNKSIGYIETNNLFNENNQLSKEEERIQKERFFISMLPLLFTGESGTGKTFAARQAHLLSKRKKGPFVAVNCAAIPDSISETEFFGSVQGAFTGSTNREGLFESANTGTIFLDEISELSLSLQAKLLKILDDGKFTRVGSNKVIQTDVRVICATNANLSEKILNGSFREDLYFRISVVPLRIKPLRERLQEIPELVLEYLQSTDKIITQSAIDKLKNYSWPGNIRQLFSCLARAVVLAETNEISEKEIHIV